MEATTSSTSLSTPQRVRTREEVLPIYGKSVVSGISCPDRFQVYAYQEDDRDIQEEGDETVQEQGEETDVVNLVHSDLGELPEQSNEEVHDSANWCKVIQRDQRVHLVLCRAQQTLNHGEADGFEDNARNLEHEADHDELDLADRCDDHTNDNRGDVQEHLQVRLRHSHTPAAEEHGDRRGSLEHLDEGDAQVQVGQIATDQAQAEEQSNWDNGPQVDPSRHLDRLAPIEEGGVASQKLCHDRREGQVVARQDDRVAYGAPLSAMRSAQVSPGRLEACDLRNSRVSRIHLLNKMTEELMLIQILYTISH